MDDSSIKNATVHISSKSHLNLTFNLYQCGRSELPPGGTLSIQADDIFMLVHIGSGTAMLECNSLDYRVGAPQGFFAFPDLQYRLHNAGEAPLDVLWLSFSGHLVESYLNRANISRPRPVFDDEGGAIGRKLKGLYDASHRMPNRYCRMVSALYDIFSLLLDANPTKLGENYVDSADFFAIKAVEFIERNYARSISVEDITVALGISRKHLYSIFNSILKISPKQYLIYYRIEKACMRLKLSQQSVLEISESVGYTNQFYFAKEFKRLTGLTPSEYRKAPDDRGNIFSYRSFVPTLKSQFPDSSLALPVQESLLSIYVPAAPGEDAGQ